MARQPTPFLKIDRTHSKFEGESAVLRVRIFRRAIEDGEFEDILGVTIRLLREIDSEAFGSIYEYDITILGDKNRQRVVQNAITQGLKGDAAGRRMLVIIANRSFSE